MAGSAKAAVLAAFGLVLSHQAAMAQPGRLNDRLPGFGSAPPALRNRFRDSRDPVPTDRGLYDGRPGTPSGDTARPGADPDKP